MHVVRRERADVHTRFWWGCLRGRDNVEDRGVKGLIILKWIFKKSDEAWSALIWLRTGTGDVLLWKW